MQGWIISLAFCFVSYDDCMVCSAVARYLDARRPIAAAIKPNTHVNAARPAISSLWRVIEVISTTEFTIQIHRAIITSVFIRLSASSISFRSFSIPGYLVATATCGE